MNSDDFLVFLAAVAVILSAAGAAVTYNSVSYSEESWVTGFITDTATVNLTVLTTASIDFTTDNINFGTGRVQTGYLSATLITTGTGNIGGNWTNVSQGFVLENVGNLNVSLNIYTGKTAATFLDGNGPQYQYNITNIESNSCMNAPGFAYGTFYDVNTTSPGTYICSNFSYLDTKDTVRIDIKLVVPSDSITGSLQDVVTVEAQPSV